MGHVRLLVESDADTPETVKAYAHLPNRVIIEYARALRAQGVDLRYDARKISAAPDGTVSIGVSIVPARKQNISEREHTLVVTLKKENNQRWAVTGIRARP